MDDVNYLTRNTMVELIAAELRETRGLSPSEQAEKVAAVIYKFYARMDFELKSLEKDLNIVNELAEIS